MDEILPPSSRKYGSQLAGGHLGPSEGHTGSQDSGKRHLWFVSLFGDITKSEFESHLTNWDGRGGGGAELKDIIIPEMREPEHGREWKRNGNSRRGISSVWPPLNYDLWNRFTVLYGHTHTHRVVFNNFHLNLGGDIPNKSKNSRSNSGEILRQPDVFGGRLVMTAEHRLSHVWIVLMPTEHRLSNGCIVLIPSLPRLQTSGSNDCPYARKFFGPVSFKALPCI